MARPRKYNKNINESYSGEPMQTEMLTEQQVFDVIQFAKEMYNMYPNVYSPDLINSRMKDITMNPLAGTSTQIDDALKNPKNSETNLRGISEYFEMTDMLYKRQIQYLGNLLSFDLSWNWTNIAKPSDYSSAAYKKDMKILYDFLDKFDVKAEFKKALRQMVKQETYYCSFRNDGDRYVLQELPSDFCKITGRCEYGLLFDFNMQLFLSPGISLDMYSSVFKEYWKRVFDGKNNGYAPQKQIDNRTGEWVLWVQTSIDDGQWCFKMNPDITTQVPFFAPLFPDLVNKPLIRTLQKNKYVIEASKMLIGFIGFNKDNKSGNVKDSLNLSVETAGKFAALVKAALDENVKFGITPFERIDKYEWNSNSVNIYDEYNRVAVAQGGTNTRLLYATDKMNVSETRNSIAIDEQVVKYAYGQFESFLNYNVNKLLKTFKVKFKLDGTEMPEDKERRMADAVTMMSQGVVLPHKIANAMGMQYHDLERELEFANATGFTDKLMPIISAYQQSSKGSEKNSEKNNGRPKKADSTLGDSGAETRESGGNED